MAERILLVDDHPLTRSALSGLLSQHGFDVVGEASDGEEAIVCSGELRPDLILLDLRMPRASGWDFLENVRANPRWHTIPVVIVSAHLEEGPDLAGDSGLNIVGQLAKPVSVSDLLAKVEDIIGPAQAVV